MENSSPLYNNLTPFLHLPVHCAEALKGGKKGVMRGVEAIRGAVGQAWVHEMSRFINDALPCTPIVRVQSAIGDPWLPIQDAGESFPTHLYPQHEILHIPSPSWAWKGRQKMEGASVWLFVDWGCDCKAVVTS